jgi:hypothetical protein
VNAYGNDPHDVLTVLPIAPGWPQAGDNGIGAEFDLKVHKRILDEESGADDIYSVVYLHDCNREFRRFQSAVINYEF